MVNLASFWKPEACGQTVLPDMSVLIGQKLVENAKIQKFICDILRNFQTMWASLTKQKAQVSPPKGDTDTSYMLLTTAVWPAKGYNFTQAVCT